MNAIKTLGHFVVVGSTLVGIPRSDEPSHGLENFALPSGFLFIELVLEFAEKGIVLGLLFLTPVTTLACWSAVKSVHRQGLLGPAPCRLHVQSYGCVVAVNVHSKINIIVSGKVTIKLPLPQTVFLRSLLPRRTKSVGKLPR